MSLLEVSLLDRLDPALASHIRRIEHFKQSLTLLTWDSRTGAPSKGLVQGARVRSTIKHELFLLQRDPEFGRLLHALSEKTSEDPLVSRIAAYHLRSFQLANSIPIKEFQAFANEQSQTSVVLAEAKKTSNFALVKPYLERVFDYHRKFSAYWGYQDHPYDAQIKQFDPDVDTATLDQVFSELKSGLLPLIQRISRASKQPDRSIFAREFPYEQQRELATRLIQVIGYDFDAGKFGETLHPFSSAISPGDARVATIYKRDVRVSALLALHEAGHSIYTQNIHPQLVDTGLGIFTSYGIHESQSIFWEKFIGRHRGFWEQNYGLAQSLFPEAFAGVKLDDFFFALNEVRPSLIRYEADDLTYNLHIIIRYELEKALLEGSISVDELPERWNDKYEEYLGIRPANDREGVLQDGHWISGFGHFATYSLGFIFAGQLHGQLVKDKPDFDRLVAEGRNDVILDWLRSHVHQYGSSKSEYELLRDITGGEIDTRPLLSYLTRKYEDLYELQPSSQPAINGE
ncbi:carboxypeptidase M32 [Paenibacillus filicis]|uniref:Metal-dependent carboxypeptidase n=1 Tax=Paenibacillus filicis TaxID=669464 RepID=A0ABU9DFU5_9BACL